MSTVLDRGLQLVAALLLVVLGFFPIVNWLPGGREAEWFTSVALDWVYGSLIAVGGGLVLAIVARSVPALWRDRGVARLLDRYQQAPLRATALIACGALVVYLAVAFLVQDGKALHLDEIMQAYQARIFASGSLARETSAHPEFFSHMLLVDTGERVFSQFPAGGPAMLAIGTAIGAEWLVVPLAGALTVLVFGWGMQRIDDRPGVRLGATLLLALAPFMVFMSGSRMNHVTSLLWLVLAVAALAWVVTSADRRPSLAFLSGIGLGMAATIRPADALVFALPAAVWYLYRTARAPQRWTEMAAAGIGVALPIGALMWVNANTTGHPLLFGYSMLWGDAHDLGFHEAPWGVAHTPARGLEQLSLYFLVLQRYLYETPFPALVPPTLALVLARGFRPMDRYLLVSAGLLVGLYLAYFHNGVYLGPRFMFPLIPLFAIWTARLPGLVRDRFGDGLPYRTTVYAYAIGAIIALTVSTPVRARAHAGNMVTSRWDASRAARAAGVEDALVLVRESWGAQLLARMWALGVTRPEAEMVYARADRCRLEHAIAEAERTGVRDREAFALLMPITADADLLVPVPFSEDPTALMLPGSIYSAVCATRVAEEQTGFTVFLPLILAEGGGNVYARDLHARDSLLLQAFPERDVYVLKPASTALGAEPQFFSASRDSMYRVWRALNQAQGVPEGD